MTIKESFAYRESPNTWGLPPLRDSRSPRTAVAVERLESAGAIVVGKTNVPVLLARLSKFQPNLRDDEQSVGPDANAWGIDRRRRRRAGRGPWLSDSRQRYRRLHPRSCAFLRCVRPQTIARTRQHGRTSAGPLGRFCRASRWTWLWPARWPAARATWRWPFAVLGGANGDDAKAWTWRLPAPRHKQLKDFRIGYVIDDPFAPVSSDIGQLYENALTALGKAGAKLERGWPPGFDLAGAVHNVPCTSCLPSSTPT